MLIGGILCLTLFTVIGRGNAACSSCHANGRKITYKASSEHLENPGRGFTDQHVGTVSHFEPLTTGYLDDKRRKTGMTILWRTYVLDTFRTKPISSDFLNKLRADFRTVHSAGMSVVVRFCYIFKNIGHAPYGDADEKHILQHIGQLKPLFHEFEGVILSVEAGFIGAWGEWFYTTYFGDPKHRNYHVDKEYGYTPQQWAARKTILTTLLDAVPQSIQVQLRYPGQKMHMFSRTPISYGDVNKATRSYAARTGHHNDCFLSADNDYTYHNAAVEKPFLAKETQYLIMGGETCRVTNNDRDHCPNAVSEMKMLHWTWLNQGFDKDMYAIWEKEGCYEEIHRRLGYRLRLTEATLPDNIQRGGNLCFSISLTNDGFAAPVKEMDVYLVLHNKANGHYLSAVVPNTDVRTYQPGQRHTISASINVPTSVPAGHYDTYLAIGDKILKTESDYYILFANNDGVPLASQGLNDLKHSLNVGSSTTSGSTSCGSMAPWTPPKHSKYNRMWKAPSSGYGSIIG